MDRTGRGRVRLPRFRVPGVAFLVLITLLAMLPKPFRGWFATYGVIHACAHVAVFFTAFLLIARRSPTMAETVVTQSLPLKLWREPGVTAE